MKTLLLFAAFSAFSAPAFAESLKCQGDKGFSARLSVRFGSHRLEHLELFNKENYVADFSKGQFKFESSTAEKDSYHARRMDKELRLDSDLDLDLATFKTGAEKVKMEISGHSQIGFQEESPMAFTCDVEKSDSIRDSVDYAIIACLIEPSGSAEPVQVDRHEKIGTWVKEISKLHNKCVNGLIGFNGIVPIRLKPSQNAEYAKLTVTEYIERITKLMEKAGNKSGK